MEITVKISDIEICIDRNEFKEFGNLDSQKDIMKDTIIPTLDKAIAGALELYNNRVEQLDKNA